MVRITNEQKAELLKKGWLIIGDVLLLADKETHEVKSFQIKEKDNEICTSTR